MWLCFGISALAVLATWIFVISRTIKYSFNAGGIKHASPDTGLRDAELKLKNFKSAGKIIFDNKNADAKEAILSHNEFIKKLEKKLQSTSTNK